MSTEREGERYLPYKKKQLATLSVAYELLVLKYARPIECRSSSSNS
jgi:hypothetical protein